MVAGIRRSPSLRLLHRTPPSVLTAIVKARTPFLGFLAPPAPADPARERCQGAEQSGGGPGVPDRHQVRIGAAGPIRGGSGGEPFRKLAGRDPARGQQLAGVDHRLPEGRGLQRRLGQVEDRAGLRDHRHGVLHRGGIGGRRHPAHRHRRAGRPRKRLRLQARGEEAQEIHGKALAHGIAGREGKKTVASGLDGRGIGETVGESGKIHLPEVEPGREVVAHFVVKPGTGNRHRGLAGEEGLLRPRCATRPPSPVRYPPRRYAEKARRRAGSAGRASARWRDRPAPASRRRPRDCGWRRAGSRRHRASACPAGSGARGQRRGSWRRDREIRPRCGARSSHGRETYALS